MFKMILPVLVVFVGTACKGGQDLKGSAAQRDLNSQAAAPSPESPIDSNSSPIQTSTELPSSDGLISSTPIVAPIAIGGASLTCDLIETNSIIRCQTLMDGKAAKLPNAKLFAAKAQAAGWIALNSTEVSLGLYTAPVPSGLPSRFAVIVQHTGDTYLSALVGEGADAYSDVIKDGSFEGIAIGANPSYYTAAQFAAKSSVWGLYTNEHSNCAVGSAADFAIYQNSSDLPPAALGSKWISLESRCTDTSGKITQNYANVAVRQDMKPLVSGHLYRVSFSARASAPVTSVRPLAKVIANWGDSQRVTVEAKSTEWRRYDFSVKAKSEAVRLNFVEMGEPDGIGTQIDDVQSIDLGPVIPPI